MKNETLFWLYGRNDEVQKGFNLRTQIQILSD